VSRLQGRRHEFTCLCVQCLLDGLGHTGFWRFSRTIHPDFPSVRHATTILEGIGIASLEPPTPTPTSGGCLFQTD